MATSAAAAPSPAAARRQAPTWLLAAAVFVLFTAWSLSFIAIEALLRPPGRPPRFDWLGLTVARFAPAALLSGGYCLLRCRAEALAVACRHPGRLLLSGLLAVPGYNFALYLGQQHRVAAPIASLLTTLAPLFVMLLSAAFLGERITGRRVAGFLLALAGLAVIAWARLDGAGSTYPAWIALTALAPLCWSIHTVLTKPVMREVSPLVWTYLAITAGTAPLLLVLPFRGGPELLALDPAGWGYLLHLTLPCTVLGFALWTWLLSHLPATSVGFTVFLNPPLTTTYKLLLAWLFPAAFFFSVLWAELLGGALVLGGVAVAVLRRRERDGPAAVPEAVAGETTG
jgi:drug/metabolite transporter (DMT)-like permease